MNVYMYVYIHTVLNSQPQIRAINTEMNGTMNNGHEPLKQKEHLQ